jgi:hypothetical protein
MKILKLKDMKTKAMKLTAILMIFSISVFAAGNFGGTKSTKSKSKTYARICPVTKDMVDIRVVKSAGETLTLGVYNENGNKVYKTTLCNGMNIRISHDISDFPNGVYTYEILKEGRSVYTCLIMKTRETILKCGPDDENATAFISQHGKNKVEVCLIKNPGTKTRIEATDQSGKTVYSQNVTAENEHRITTDISDYPAGEFTFTVYAGNNRIAEKSIVKK